MTYRTAGPDRLYVCPGCSAPQRAPEPGGVVVCPECRREVTLPARDTSKARAGPPQPPTRGQELVRAPAPGALAAPAERVEALRLQRGRRHEVSPALRALLGGDRVGAGGG